MINMYLDVFLFYRLVPLLKLQQNIVSNKKTKDEQTFEYCTTIIILVEHFSYAIVIAIIK